jgi:hypothetical protein
MPKVSTHLTEINGIEYTFKAVDGLYIGAVAAAVGITRATQDEAAMPEYSVKELLQKGVLYRLSAITLVGGRKRRLKMLVAKDKLATALDDLKDKTYALTGGSSGTIKSVGFATRVVSRG